MHKVKTSVNYIHKSQLSEWRARGYTDAFKTEFAVPCMQRYLSKLPVNKLMSILRAVQPRYNNLVIITNLPGKVYS